MAKTYTTLARAHHELYGTFVDYAAEFRSYDRVLRRAACHRVLEVGCGSGNLSRRFVDAGYDYVGLDRSRQFLAIAREVAPRARFVLEDMRRFAVRRRFDAVLVTGRTFTHMTTNADVLAALGRLHAALRPRGLLVFDNFDAGVVFKNPKRRFVSAAVVGDRRYRRVMSNTMRPESGWVWHWSTRWTIGEKGRTRTIRDAALLRAFTPDELRLLLEWSGFEDVRTRRKGAILVTVARRGDGSPGRASSGARRGRG